MDVSADLFCTAAAIRPGSARSCRALTPSSGGTGHGTRPVAAACEAAASVAAARGRRAPDEGPPACAASALLESGRVAPLHDAAPCAAAAGPLPGAGGAPPAAAFGRPDDTGACSSGLMRGSRPTSPRPGRPLALDLDPWALRPQLPQQDLAGIEPRIPGRGPHRAPERSRADLTRPGIGPVGPWSAIPVGPLARPDMRRLAGLRERNRTRRQGRAGSRQLAGADASVIAQRPWIDRDRNRLDRSRKARLPGHAGLFRTQAATRARAFVAHQRPEDRRRGDRNGHWPARGPRRDGLIEVARRPGAHRNRDRHRDRKHARHDGRRRRVADDGDELLVLIPPRQKIGRRPGRRHIADDGHDLDTSRLDPGQRRRQVLVDHLVEDGRRRIGRREPREPAAAVGGVRAVRVMAQIGPVGLPRVARQRAAPDDGLAPGYQERRTRRARR